MENNNGRGIFYGVIGVATLVVAIIGATFAYFSASISSEPDAIGATSTTIELEMEEVATGIKVNLIPVDETQAGFATGGYVGIAAADTNGDGVNDPKSLNCVDDDGNEFCSVYQFTIKNPSTTTSQTVYAEMDVQNNTFSNNAPDSGDSCTYLEKTGEAMYCNKSNLAFAIFKGAAINDNGTSDITNWDVDGSAVTTTHTAGAEGNSAAATATTVGNTAGTSVVGALGDMVVGRTATSTGTGENFRLSALDQTLKPEGEVTYTVVVWLHENYEAQDEDEGQAFTAGITFSTSLGGTGVTAILGTSNAS